MRVLLTNDDGIFADGIQELSKIMQKLAAVYIVAPDRERSAVGHAITMHHPLRAERVKLFHNPNLPAWAVNGTPSDCVKLAVEAILPERPDIVISGINRGGNLGTDVLYSGTVSAAVEGIISGIPSIAISITDGDNPDFKYAAEFAGKLAVTVLEKGLPSDTLLNVNIPGLSRNELEGVAVTRLGMTRYNNEFEQRVDPRGRSYYWMVGEVVELDNGHDSDLSAIRENKISITPIHFDFTNYKIMNTLKKWPLEF
ncbi:MAG: 5'/3'-nucleotidase SurE [Firmicutes bacterium HGW-Firmicutes-13]|nr:MAG: 5'/3'-nucleotidase SurE [Firmicutes bacterium HGW-Firmicutes-13]